MIPAIHPPSKDGPLKLHPTMRFQVLATEVTMPMHPIITPVPSDSPMESMKLRMLEVVEGRLSIPPSLEQFLRHDVLEWRAPSDGGTICKEPQTPANATPTSSLNDLTMNEVVPNMEAPIPTSAMSRSVGGISDPVMKPSLSMQSTLRFQILTGEHSTAAKAIVPTPLSHDIPTTMQRLKVLEVEGGRIANNSDSSFLNHDVLGWYQHPVSDGALIPSIDASKASATDKTIIAESEKDSTPTIVDEFANETLETAAADEWVLVDDEDLPLSPMDMSVRYVGDISEEIAANDAPALNDDDHIVDIPEATVEEKALMVMINEESSPIADTLEIIVEDTEVLFLGTIEEYPDSSIPEVSSNVVVVDMEATSIAQDREMAIAVEGQKALPSSSASTASVSSAASTKENDTSHVVSGATNEKVPLHQLTTTANSSSTKLSYAEMAKRTQTTSSTVATSAAANKASKPVVRDVENVGVPDRATRDRPKSSFVPSLGKIVVATATDAPPRSASSSPQKSSKGAKNDSASMGKTQDPYLLIVTSVDVTETSVILRHDKVIRFLETMSIQYKVLQAADPKHQNECQGLFALSGMRHVFPQFFHVDTSGIPAFYGTIDAMEQSMEDGTFLQKYGSLMRRHANDGVAVPVKETPANVTASKSASLVVLLSQQSLDRNVKSNQDRALLILDSKRMPYTVIDGADPKHHAVRNNLFQVSGLRAKYPQFFIEKDGEAMTFVGDWDHFQSLHEAGDLSGLFKALDGPATQVSPGPAVPEVAVLGNGASDVASAPAAVSSSPPTSATTDAPSTARSNVTTGKGNSKVASSSSSVAATSTNTKDSTKTEITIYGATSFVAQHALDYFMQVSLTLNGKRTITLAGRNESKLTALQKTLTQKMSNLVMLDRKSIGQCVFDVFVADSADVAALKRMAERSDLIANFAGPYTQYGEHVVAACAQCGTNYIDITGEISWAGQMRQKYSVAAERSGARIISLCGFDSIPSDISIFACVDALRKSKKSDVPVERATTWHSSAGMVNGGTIHSALGMPLNLRNCFSQKVPFLLDDPLVLTHPRTRSDPDNQALKNRMAMHEWLNQLPSFDSILVLGASAPFFMSVVNAKVVQASALALKYGPNFKYRERFLPVGLEHTRKLGILSIIPALLVQFGIMIGFAVLRTPFIGKFLADWLSPPGSGAPDYMCKSGYAKVYAEVSTAPSSASGNVDKATCFLEFEGDPGNWVTAQCLCESALALTLDKTKLPTRSLDGFGTPAELLGSTLLRRLQATKVRPVKLALHVRKNVPLHETVVFCGSSNDEL